MNTNNQQFTISLNSDDLKQIADDTKRRFIEAAKQKATDLTRGLLADGKDYYNTPKGAAYLLLQEKLESQILEADTQKFAEEYIKQNWNRHLTEALDKAMQHKANKTAFQMLQAIPVIPNAALQERGGIQNVALYKEGN